NSMAAHREAWHNSEMKTMVLFMHDFLKGRFDNHLRNIGEREMAKTQPSGMKAWCYLERLPTLFDEWDLGEVNHPIASCQSKWSKYLQTRLHDVEGVPPEKVLFLYCKLGTKLTGATQRITRQYPGYELVWRNDTLKDYKKKFNLHVEIRRAEKENEEKKKREKEKENDRRRELSANEVSREAEGGKSEERMERETRRSKRIEAASTSNGGPIEHSNEVDQSKERDQMVFSAADEQPPLPPPPLPPSSPRTARREQRAVKREQSEEPVAVGVKRGRGRTRKATAPAKKVKKEEPEDEEGEKDVKPSSPILRALRKQTRANRVSREIKEEPENGLVEGPIEKSTVVRMEKSIDGGGRKEEEENEATPSATTPLVGAAIAADAAASSSDPNAVPPPEAAKRTISAESMEEVWEGLGRVEGEEEGEGGR
ncbi:hypothetical protein PENTCL1PPCAC_23442, partial [Pristionchus entomophagus]